MMNKTFLLSLGAALSLSAGYLHAEKKPQGDPIDQNAVALMKRMSTTLSQAKSFTFRTDSILEIPCDTGQFLTVVSKGFVAVQRPNKIRAMYVGDAHAFDFFYDGSSVTAVAPRQKLYSTTRAPDTIDEMLSGIRKETGLHLHIAPLLFSNSYEHLARNLQTAVIIGPSFVNGVPCDHLAFRSPGVNWELWISSGPVALPYRMAATFTDKPNLPRKLIDLSSWNLHPWLHASLFSFKQSQNFQEIPFKTVLKDVRQEATRRVNH
jgi:hypothetical protein